MAAILLGSLFIPTPPSRWSNSVPKETSRPKKGPNRKDVQERDSQNKKRLRRIFRIPTLLPYATCCSITPTDLKSQVLTIGAL
ncbi:hypothetical protein HUJ05_005945 [Dendroctonus ponderosae]|nr:hypothetical protein HUJ05_005945 [Dendroctonus ponderosae]